MHPCTGRETIVRAEGEGIGPRAAASALSYYGKKKRKKGALQAVQNLFAAKTGKAQSILVLRRKKESLSRRALACALLCKENKQEPHRIPNWENGEQPLPKEESALLRVKKDGVVEERGQKENLTRERSSRKTTEKNYWGKERCDGGKKTKADHRTLRVNALL